MGKGVAAPEVDYRQVRDASVRGAGAGSVVIGVRVLLRLASMVVLARLLTPRDFGLVAMTAPVLGLFTLMVDWGLTMASTQSREIRQDQLSALFWINAGAGVLLALLMIAVSPLLVLIFGEARLIGLSAALSATLVAHGLRAQHEALLRRRLRYGFLHASGAAAGAIGLAVAILAALAGLGVWSLVWWQLTVQGVQNALLWQAARWKPSRPTFRVDIRPFLRYGNRFAPTSLLYHLARSFDGFVVGAAAGAGDLGLYRKAHGVIMEPLQLLIHAVHRIVPASLSRLQDDDHRFARFYLHALGLISFAGWSAIGLAAAEAPALVTLLLGDQWLASIPLVRWLAPGAMAMVLGTAATDWAYSPRGEFNRLLLVRAVRLGSAVVGVLAGWWVGGVAGVAIGYTIASVAAMIVEIRAAVARMPVHARHVIGVLLRPLLAAAAAAAVVVLVPTHGSALMLVLQCALYLLVFLGLHALLPGGRQVTAASMRAVHSALGLRNAS